MVRGTRRGGRHLPTSVGDYTCLDPFAAELAFELITVIRTGYPTSSDFLRAHMAAPDAPACIAGDPEDRSAFEAAKKAMSRRIGRTAREIAEWDLVTFVHARCGRDDTTHPYLAGLWQASQRYLPPGYCGPVRVPDDAPPPYADTSEAPDDGVRAAMLFRQLSEEQDNSRRRSEAAVREFREAHETSLMFYERELTELRVKYEHQRECERLLIRIIAWQRRCDRSAAEHETVTALRRELDEVTAALHREKADHNLTANRLAFVAACLDAVSAGGDTDPVLWLRDADFPLGADLYCLLNQPEMPRTRTEPEAVARFLTVYLRTYLISWFGDAPDRDDTVGPYRDIVRNGVLPSAEVLENVLQPHTIALQVAHPLMRELAVEGPAEAPQLPDGPADVHTLEVLGGEHRAGVLEKPINVVDLIQNLTRRPGDTA
ncbi:hypothetical protein SAMN05660733_02007 [Lentzea albidocapillata]|uniref:Uncharacterized protein n=1 Tax=Lentzea albidocapillata TaxID=40571 RepID=A0A1W2CG25_9PSEU|nr:hypothetical protein SAMN05660733_02007 [Lentzea albidocapillata]